MDAEDLAAELVHSGRAVTRDGVISGRLRPYAEWAGGEALEAAMHAREAARLAAEQRSGGSF